MISYKERAAYEWSEDSIRLIVTPSMTARSMLYYVQEAGIFQTKPGYFTEREYLNSFLVVYTVSGQGRLKYRGQSYTLRPGDVFFIDCMEDHRYETDPDDLWRILWVHFNGSSSQGYYQQYSLQGSPVIKLGPESGVPRIIERLIDIHRQKDVRAEWAASLLLVELLTELLAAGSGPMSARPIPKTIEAVMKDMDQRFFERITLDEWAAKHAMSKYQLAKQFKKYTGVTPNEYVIRLRMTFAKELLAYSDDSVAEIAAKAGIDNVSHFINLFKAREGVTPLAYRKAWRLADSP
jgi:AraC-like DNA-binding protein